MTGLTRHAGATPYTTFKMLGSPPARTPFPRTPALSRSGGKKPRPNPGHARKRTGFSPAVILAARTRAGGGDPAQARCECHGHFLGLHGGEIQHIIARAMGGTSLTEINSVQNAAVMCEPGHALAEARDPEMYERGFWRKRSEKVGAAPLMLHGADGGFTRWLTGDGGYSTEAPGVAA